jgi:hypothetical protein
MSIDRIDSNSTINLMNLEDLVTFELGGDVSAGVAQCLLASARDARDRTELERTAAEKHLAASEQKQVESLYEQADHIRAAGWVQGLGMMASGTLGAIGAINGLNSVGSKVTTAAAAAEYTASALSNAGKVAEGIGAIGRGLEDAAGKECEANASSAASGARHLERRLQELQQETADARAQAQSAIESVGELSALQARQAQASLFIRG